jgi:hypothetical protein
MKPHLEIKAFVCGEWETVTTRPGRRFYPGTARLVPSKPFPVSGLEKAKAWATATGYPRWKITRVSPPVPPSRTWGEEDVFENQPVSA